MGKLQGKSKLSNFKNNGFTDENKKKLTTVSSKSNITTGLSPKTFRFTREETSLLVTLTQSLQEQTNKNLTESKVVRGLVWLATNKQKIWKELMNEINKNL